MATSVLLRLRDAGCVFAEDEARLLCKHARDEDHLYELVERRIAGEPLEHLLGFVEFLGRPYDIGPGVFIPRQRSALLVEVATWIGHGDSGGTILDLCCGVGALGIAVRNRLAGRVIGADISPDAVAYAVRNGVREAYVGDLFDAVPESYRGEISVLIANTPYVPSDAVADMPRESRDYEPQSAVDGGPDGLALQRRVLAQAPDWLAPGGSLFTETSGPQAEALLQEAVALGWNAWVIRDRKRGAYVLVGNRDVDNSYPQPQIFEWNPRWSARRFKDQGKGAIVALANDEIELKLSRNHNDIDELYTSVIAIEETVDGIQRTLVGHGQQLAEMGRTLSEHSGRLDRIETRLDSLESKMDEVLRRLPS